MSDDLNPDDPFTDDLGARMHAAADHLDGTGVTRLGVDAAVGHRRRLRTRSLVAGAAAALVLVGGLAAVAALGREDGAERISTAAPTTTDPGCAAGTPSSLLSQAQVDAVIEDARSLGHATATTVATAHVEEGSGQTPFQEWVEVLREAGLLTVEQEAEAAAGRGFALTEEQSRVLQEHWDAQAQGPTTTVLVSPPTTEPAEDPCSGSTPRETDTTAPVTTAVTSTTVPASPTTPEPGSDDHPATTTTTIDPRRPTGAPEQVDAGAIKEGDELWAVYLDTWAIPRTSSSVVTTTTPDGHNPVSSGEDRWWAAEGRAAALGYQGTLTELACEEPASGAGLIPPAVGGFQNWAVAVYFATEADARAFAHLLPGTEAATSHIRFTCAR